MAIVAGINTGTSILISLMCRIKGSVGEFKDVVNMGLKARLLVIKQAGCEEKSQPALWL